MEYEQITAAKTARNKYAKQWRSKNRDKVRAANLRYWARRAEREAAQEASDQRGDRHG